MKYINHNPSIILLNILFVIIFASFKFDNLVKLRTDGYYYTNDTLTNTQTGQVIVRFWPMFLFDDRTISDLYYHDSKNEFESYIQKKTFKWVKKFSKFGDYRISNDSIFIHIKTYQNKWPDSEIGSTTDSYMKGIVINDSTIDIVEHIFMSDTLRFQGDFIFNFARFQFKK